MKLCTIEEAKTLKITLEGKIKTVIEHFETSTGLEVSTIHLDRYSSIGHEDQLKVVSTSVSLR